MTKRQITLERSIRVEVRTYKVILTSPFSFDFHLHPAMEGSSYIQDIWDQHLLIVECNRQFINSDILEKIYLAEINSKNRYRNMLTAVKQIVTCTSLDRDPEALVRRVKTKKGGREAVYVAAKIMKLIIVCGLRDHTWNQVRKDFVSFFFSRELIPDVDPYNVSFPNNVLINASVLNNVPSMLLPLTTRVCPFPLAHLADPSNHLTELRADRNFHYVKMLRMCVKPGKS